jgi:hypothetical protein
MFTILEILKAPPTYYQKVFVFIPPVTIDSKKFDFD